MKEYEVKILGADLDDLGRRIILAGGLMAHERTLYRRWNYSQPGWGDERWLRVRTDPYGGGHLTFKQVIGDEIGDVIELETAVSDVDRMRDILAAMDCPPMRYQETYRTRYRLGHSVIDCDEWPGVPPWAEVEGPDRDAVLDTLALLGYSEGDVTTATAVEVYNSHGIDIQAIPDLTFETFQGAAR